MKLFRYTLLLCLNVLLITAAGQAQTSLHYWDFNAGVSGTPWATPISATQTVGGGSLAHPFGANTDAFAGSTLDAAGFTSATAGASFSIVSSASNGQAFILTVPTTGYSGIKFTYATRGTATGFATHTIDYTTDGTNYINLTTISGRTSTTFTLQTVDFSAITAANDNPNFKIKVTVAGASNTTGNNRLDNMRVTGTVITVPNSVAVAAGTNAAEGGSNGSFNINLTPATTGTLTVDYAFTGTATFSSDYSVSFTGATSNSSTASGTLTIPSGTNTVVATVTPVDDAQVESTETITLTLSNPTGGYALGITNASINLTDNDLAAISFTGAYSQDFNTLATGGLSSSLPTGWLLSESGTNANTTYTAGDGSGNAGDSYSFGTAASTDRALGGLRSSSLIPTIGAIINNNTGATLSSFQISYTGEQWRLGATGRSDKLDFQYSTNATSLSNGTWTDVDGLDFIAPVSSGTVGSVDGNATANRTALNYTINGLSIPAGANFLVRWLDVDAAGSDDGLGIDDISFSLGCTPPSNQATVLNLTPALQSISGSFTAAAAGSTAADTYLVLLSSSASLTATPVSGTVYNVDDIIGNARVINIGTAASFTASGLNPSTPYYFYVFSSVAASNCFNTNNPLTGNTSTTTPPACTAPSTQASGLTATNITGVSMDISYTRGSGDNVLVLARANDPINAAPINSLNYTVGTEIGTGNFVVYNGSATGFTHSGLAQNTLYQYALYEYNNTNFCYTMSPLTGSFTTLCVNPVNVSAFGAGIGNAQISLGWTLPSGTCFDEIIIVASTAPITATGDTYTGSANAAYAGGEQIVYRGTGTSVNITGLANGTTYYFKAFTRKGSLYSSGNQVTGAPFDPATGYLYLFGNIHAHSSYSDGNKDNTSKVPIDDYAFARDALCMDFLGISEHNHSGAGMNYPDFALGYNQSNTINGQTGPGGNSIVTLYGMEWGVISGGGHVLVYGFDNQLIGWEPGNYDIFVGKNVYNDLWPVVNNKAGAFASLAHPNPTDYTNLASAYNSVADNAISGVAVESGPAFSTSTTYNDFPSSLGFLSYYKTLLAKGFHVSPTMDQDNHNLTFGTANSNRLVVLTSGRTRAAIMEALRNGRFYASEDCNARVDFKNGAAVMGSASSGAGVPSLTLGVTDPDGESSISIELWGGLMGGSVPSAPLKIYSNLDNISFSATDVENVQPDNSSWYYFAIITQADGNKIVSAPVYYSRSDIALPLNLLAFTATYNRSSEVVDLNWSTVAEINTKMFGIERSNDNGRTWLNIGNTSAAGNRAAATVYQFTDKAPLAGTNYYRLKMSDMDDRYTYSPIRSASISGNGNLVYSIYPNPAAAYTWLNSTSTAPEKITVVVTDNNGRQITQQVYTASNGSPAKIMLTGLRPGLYYLKLVSAKGTGMLKLAVQ